VCVYVCVCVCVCVCVREREMCQCAVLSFSDGMVTVRYGSNPYNTVEEIYAQTVLVQIVRILPFCREKRGPGLNSRSELRILLLHPNLFLSFFLLTMPHRFMYLHVQ